MKKENSEMTKEMKQGLNGSGLPVYCVFILKGNECIFIHYFDTKAEALNWIKWA